MDNGLSSGGLGGHITGAHKTFVKEFNWSEEIGIVGENGQGAMDSFWILTPVSRENAFEIIDHFRKNIEPFLEKTITNNFPVTHTGASPFLKTLYFATSSKKELLEDHYICIDFPMVGGFITYEDGLTIDELEGTKENVREYFEDSFQMYAQKSNDISPKFEGAWEIHWGFLENALQYPNMVYFAEDNSFLYLEDEYDKQVSPHPIFFDYYDIVVDNSTEIDQIGDEITFTHQYNPEKQQGAISVAVDDISIVVEEVEGDIGDQAIVNTSKVAEFPLKDLTMDLRNMLTIEYTNQVSK